MKTKLSIFCLLICWSISVTAYSFEQPPKYTVAKPENSQLLSDWIKLQLKLIRSTKGLSQGQITKHFTITSIAFYESIVVSDQQYKSLGGQLQELEKLPTMPLQKSISWQASANAAYASMMRTFYGANPQNIVKIDSLEAANVQVLQKEKFSSEALQGSIAYGKSIAAAITEWSKSDGSAKTYPPYEIPKGPGLWEPTPPSLSAPAGPYMYHNRTCVKGSIDNTLPAVPVAFSTDLTSSFYKMVKEVHDVSKSITNEQKAIALFWDDFPDGRYYGGLGHWASILSQVLTENKTPLMKGAEAFAKMSIALSDAMLACWKGKYTYNVLRPVTYINNHMNLPDWKPLIITPAHPEYPAAHASISTAAAAALTDALGSSIAFTDHSYDDLGFKPRSFKNFEEAGREAGMSRLYGGIHYTPSIEAGNILGKKTATQVLKGLNFSANK